MINVRLNYPLAWKPAQDSRLEYIIIDFLESYNVSGMTVQGDGDDSWVESIAIDYSAGGDAPSWSTLLDAHGLPAILAANTDESSHRHVDFGRLIGARYLKIVPWQWHQSISMRLEIFGCLPPDQKVPIGSFTTPPALVPEMTTTRPTPAPETPAPETPAPETPTLLPAMCSPCPNLNVSLIQLDRCACPSGLMWDGSGCVALNKCPCFEGGVKYDVGAVFQRHRDCSICVCQLERE